MLHGEKKEDVSWPTINNFSHFPPRSPVPSAGSPLLDSCAGRSFMPQISNGDGKGERQANNKDAHLPVEPPWLNELLDSPKLSMAKFSHRRSASDTIAFHPYPTILSRIDETEDENMFAHPCTRLSCFLDYDHLDGGKFGITHPYLEALESNSKVDQILFTQLPNTVQMPDLCSSFQNWRLGDSVSKLSTSTSTLQNNGVGVYRDNAGLGGSRFVDTRLALNSIQECKTCDEYGDPCSVPNSGHDSGSQQARKHSVQRSRVRKLQYIAELEILVNSLQVEISAIAPQVAFLDHQRKILIAENKALKKKLMTLTKDGQYRNAHVEVLKSEVQRCKLLFQQQKKQALPHLQPHAAISRACDLDHRVERMKPAVSDNCHKLPISPHHHGVFCPMEGGYKKGKTTVKKNCMPSNCTWASNCKSWDAQINGGVLL